MWCLDEWVHITSVIDTQTYPEIGVIGDTK